jgi:hypothetical protein
MVRVWVAGCSTGEEAYSFAIVFKEALERIKPEKSFSLQIFATDLDKDAIDKARAGVYPPNITADVSDERLREFFVDEDSNYRVRKDIREMVIFAPQNLVMHPPFTKLDFVTCRNLLIYLDAELQKKLMPLFQFGWYTHPWKCGDDWHRDKSFYRFGCQVPYLPPIRYFKARQSRRIPVGLCSNPNLREHKILRVIRDSFVSS